MVVGESASVNVGRAIEILRGLNMRAPAVATVEETTALEALGLVRSFTQEAKGSLETEIGRLGSVADQLRGLSRSIDASAGPIAVSSPSAGAPPAHEAVRALTTQVEELTRIRALFDSLVWNDATSRYLQITLDGRRTLVDLAVWRPRVGDLPLETFQRQMADLRQGFERTILRAATVVNFCARALPYLPPDLRTAGVILAKESLDPERTAAAVVRYHQTMPWSAAPPADQLLAATLLAAIPEDPAAVVPRFEASWRDLLAHEPYPEMQAVLAASLTELSPEDRARALARLAAIRPNVSTRSPVALLGLSRSMHTVEEASARYRASQEALMALGVAGGDSLDAAAAILASSPMLVPVLAERVGRLLGELRGVFDPPIVAAAMLSSSPLEPNESHELFKEAVGAVSRMNFFDLTLEIDDLALLMVYGSGPEIARFTLEGIPPAPGPLVEPVLARPSVWYTYHDFWIHRPRALYLRTHPAHIHTIPYFG
ncbi:MAG: hypothetical protein A3K66_04335 [Euryarchaeota archaeon RBG_16_67_27]|nr:MAG: hypothetical protein A3K66_04335 [Euryarchaeota archaeon RBG_16_67_27]